MIAPRLWVTAIGGRPNNAMKLTKPIQVRAPRHSASLHRAPCRVARSSLMRASQLIAVFYGPCSGTVRTDAYAPAWQTRMARGARVTDDEADLVKFERESWRDGVWPPAIISFSSRHMFLPLLRMRDRVRGASAWERLSVQALFYPLYAAVLVVWCLLA